MALSTVGKHYTPVWQKIQEAIDSQQEVSLSKGESPRTQINQGLGGRAQLPGRDAHSLSQGRSCPSSLRIIRRPQNRVKCPHLTTLARGQCHGLTPFFLPTRLVGTPMALRHPACCLAKLSTEASSAEFIPIKPLAAKGSGAPGSYAGHSRSPSPHRGRPPSRGGSDLSQCDSASHYC